MARVILPNWLHLQHWKVRASAATLREALHGRIKRHHSPQPGLKALAAKRPGFPVAVDDEIGKAGAFACVKEPGGRRDIEEDVRAAHGVRPSSARPMAT
jgi:hypothetical protein